MKSKKVSPKPEVVCDVCGNPIILQKSKLKHKEFPDGIHFDYFMCRYCKAKYVTLVTDPELRINMQLRGRKGSSSSTKTRALELKVKYSDRIKELP